MGWCNDINNKKNYNKLIKVNKNIKHEKLLEKITNTIYYSNKLQYKKAENWQRECNFVHLTRKYQPTRVCSTTKKIF